jgi:hypothetical protein
MECTADINAANAARVAKERPGVRFAAIDVSITKMDAVSVWFTTRGTDDNPHPYSCRKSDVWMECPSTAQGPGERGSLMLSSAALSAKSLKDGTTRIKGTIPDHTGKVQVNVKWPDNAGDAEPVAPLEIWPTKIIIEGYAHDDKAFQGTISLLDPSECSSSQAILLDSSGTITLMLTDDGFRRFSLGMPDSQDLPPQDVVTEAPFDVRTSNGDARASASPARVAAIWEELIGYLAEAVVARIHRDEDARRDRSPRSPSSADAVGKAPPAMAAPMSEGDVRQVLERLASDFADLKNAMSAS